MAIATYLRQIGRGKQGARSLSRVQAHDLLRQVLDGEVTDLELGAFVIAMRVKGESADELAGFVDAAQARCLAIDAPAPVVVLPSYNGARKLPVLTPLLAQLLAAEGVAVLVHGPLHDPGRVTSAEVVHTLGLPIARSADEVHDAWRRREPAFMPIDALCPPLARLLDVRRTIGLRNSGHTVAKLLAPSAGCLRVMHHTHPEYGVLLQDFIALTRADALLLRGTEGEPVADPRRAPKLSVFIDGVERSELSRPQHEGVLSELPLLPRQCDAATTALYVQAVASGEKPAPRPLLLQVQTLLQTLAAMGERPGREASG